MSKIDDTIIERVYSPIAGCIQHRFGVCQWRASLTCLDGTIAFYLAAVAFTIAGKGIADGIFADLLAALAWLMIMSFLRGLALRQAGSSMGVQSARLGEWLFRTILIAVLPLSLYHVSGWSSFCYSASLLFLVSHLYFKASDSPPPQTRPKHAFARG